MVSLKDHCRNTSLPILLTGNYVLDTIQSSNSKYFYVAWRTYLAFSAMYLAGRHSSNIRKLHGVDFGHNTDYYDYFPSQGKKFSEHFVPKHYRPILICWLVI